MKKVILTKEQANAIEEIKKGDEGGITYGNIKTLFHKQWTHPPFNSLNTLNTKEFLDALYIGYEVKPEFKVGDWVYHQSDGIVSQITRVNFNKLVPDAINTDGHKGWISCEDIRHATSEEIKQEKERRWWEKHGREVWELKDGDVLISKNTGKLYEVVRDFSDIIRLNTSIYFIDAIKQEFKVVCFAEQRLDKEDTQ